MKIKKLTEKRVREIIREELANGIPHYFIQFPPQINSQTPIDPYQHWQRCPACGRHGPHTCVTC